MSKRTLRADDVEGFMVAAWDEKVDTEKLYGVEVFIRLYKQPERGKWTFIATADKVNDAGVTRPVALARRDWPSHRYTSLHACLYALLMSLNIEVQKAYREEHGHWYSSPVEEPAKND